jgi:hypothetical protein
LGEKGPTNAGTQTEAVAGASCRRRRESRGIPPEAQEEIAGDAITAVVMSARGVENEQHLIGAFWVVSCCKVYAQLRREMRGREFQRRAVAALAGSSRGLGDGMM